MRKVTCAAAAAMFAVCVGSSTRANNVNLVQDNGFESPDLGSNFNSFKQGFTAGSWNFVGGGGIAANGSAFLFYNGDNASNGNSDGTKSTAGQAGVIQGGDGTIGGSSISQYLMLDAGTYDFSVDTEGRDYYGLGGPDANPMTMYVENQAMTGTYLDLNISPLSTSTFNTFTGTFTVPKGGTYGLYFVGDGQGGSDVSSYVDNVSVSVDSLAAVPLPSSAWAGLTLMGGLGLLKLRKSNV